MADEPNLAEFEALQAPKRLCVVARLPEMLEPADLRNLHAAFGAGYSNRIIAQWLIGRGVKTSEASVRKHRIGDCGCE